MRRLLGSSLLGHEMTAEPHSPPLPEAVIAAARLRRDRRVHEAVTLVETALTDARAKPSNTPFRDRVLLGLTLADLLLLADQSDRARTLLDSVAAFAEQVLHLTRQSGSPDQVLAASAGCYQLRDRVIQLGLLGQEAPELDVTHWVNTDPPTLADLRGDVVLLDFWAPWCRPCAATFPWLRDLHQRYARDGLDILALTNFRSGDAAHRNLELDMVTQFIADHDVEFAVGIAENERLRQRYGANGIPTYVVLDRAGIVRRASSKPDKVTLEQAIVGLLDTRQAVADD